MCKRPKIDFVFDFVVWPTSINGENLLHYNNFNEFQFVLVHAGYLFVFDTLSTPTFMEPPGSFNSSQINACTFGFGGFTRLGRLPTN